MAATQELYFIFNDVLNKQKDLWPCNCLLDVLWQMFSCHFMKSDGWNSAQRNLNQFFLWRYDDDIFVLVESAEHFSKFFDYFNTCHPNMSFSFEQEKNGKLSFLDIEVSWEKGKSVTTIYRKPTFSGVFWMFFANNQQIWYIWFTLLLIIVSKCVLIGQSFLKNSVFWNNSS